MTIQIKRFGNILTSRVEGREAALLLLANDLRTAAPEITLDFEGVMVMTPSWLGEFVNTLETKIANILYAPSANESVKASVQMTQAMPKSS